MTSHGNAQRPAKKQYKYSYTLISDVKDGQTVDLYGVVKYFTTPAKSRGNDVHRYITLVDPSVTDMHGGGLNINCFNPQESGLPQVERVGDILRMHRIKINTFNKKLQGTGSGKRGSSYVAFSGEPGISVEPRASSANFTFTEDDERKVEDLRHWAASSIELQREISPQQIGPVFTTLAFLPAPKRYFNFICQIIAVVQLNPQLVLARVWDGTQPRRQVMPQLPDDHTLVVRIPDDLMVDILIYDNHVNDAMQLRPGDLAQMNNLHVKEAGSHPTSLMDAAGSLTSLARPSGALRNRGENRCLGSPSKAAESAVELFLHGGDDYGRGLRKLDDNMLERRLRERLDRTDIVFQPDGSTTCHQQHQLQVVQSSSTVAGNAFLPFATIRQIKRSKVPGRFRVRAKVVRHWPADVTDFVRLQCTSCRCMFSCPSKEVMENVEEWAKSGEELTDKDFPACDVDSSASIKCFAPDVSVSSGEKIAHPACPTGVLSSAGLWWDSSRHPLCPHCTTEGSTVQLLFVYAFALVLRDDTGEIDARVYGEDGSVFFGLVPATNLHVDNCSFQHVQTCIKALIGSDDRPSLAECCIKSYHLVSLCNDTTSAKEHGAAAEPWDMFTAHNCTMYRIFDTVVEQFSSVS